MQQTTAARPDPVTKTYGSVTITASRTIEGGYAINTFLGPNREPALCLATADRDTYRTAYKVIRAGGQMFAPVDDIAAALHAALTADLHRMQRRRDTPSRRRADELNDLLDRLASPADQRILDDLAADLARPRTFRELRDAHAAAQAADRDARKRVTR
jgi:hypothetical protein